MVQIALEIKETLQTEDVAVIIEADHLYIASRGIEDVNSSTVTSSYYGKFLNPKVGDEFLSYLHE